MEIAVVKCKLQLVKEEWKVQRLKDFPWNFLIKFPRHQLNRIEWVAEWQFAVIFTLLGCKVLLEFEN